MSTFTKNPSGKRYGLFQILVLGKGIELYYSAVVKSAHNCAEIFIASLVNVDMTFLQSSRPTLIRTLHIPLDSIFAIAFYFPIVCKTQRNLNTFDERFSMLEAVLCR